MSTSRRPAKRRRVAGGIGQPTEDDEVSAAQAQASAPTATALSTRHMLLSIPSLTSLCIRVFADNLKKLSENPPLWGDVRSWLKALPDPLAQRVFTALKSTCPQLLDDELITTVRRARDMRMSMDDGIFRSSTSSSSVRRQSRLTEVSLESTDAHLSGYAILQLGDNHKSSISQVSTKTRTMCSHPLSQICLTCVFLF